MTRSLAWYAQRLRRMSAGEVAGRTADHVRQLAWARQRVRPGEEVALPAGVAAHRDLLPPLPADARERVPQACAAAVIAAADRVLAGEWTLLGSSRPDIASPDWFLDTVTGRRSPQDVVGWRIDHRDEDVTGNVKAVWELSRHHHLTVLASAWWLTGQDDYAQAVDRQLRSWWRDNPFLSGVHWTSGIELGVRLTSWVWIRRLLHEWPKVGDLFEGNDDALRQLWWHQRFLAAFPSRGSSTNNHAVAEASGLLSAASAFPWYAESQEWQALGRRRLQRHLQENTFGSGLNREQATDYHRFVTELGLVAALEADASGQPLDDSTWRLLTSSLDAAAALVDDRGRPPRQGDGDDGRALVLDDPESEAWGLMLGLGDVLVGRQPWWPEPQRSVLSVVAEGLARPRHPTPDRPTERPLAFSDAGLTVMRTSPADGPEIWCRCDGGPHGFLSIAAHAHADALAVEVRHDGDDILADPGTYCYHGEPKWRSYFRSTLAHNTVEIDGTSQSVETGPFMWGTQAATEVFESGVDGQGVHRWRARLTGYAHVDEDLQHTRTVLLDPSTRLLSVTDEIAGSRPHDMRLVFHLGPSVDVVLADSAGHLRWSGAGGRSEALLRLPDELSWSAHRGESDPVLGWYSPRFGERVPTTTLVGEGRLGSTIRLVTTLAFADRRKGGSDG